MKTKFGIFLIVIISCLGVNDLFAQRDVVVVRPHHPHYHNRRVMVVSPRPVYHPRKVVVYRPIWSPQISFTRRWVFFPRYNFYWDNYRQVYVYPHQGRWICQTNQPVFIGNINLAQERHYELSENDNNYDEIYTYNHQHRNQYGF